MENKVLWVLVTALILVAGYNAYNIEQNSQQVNELRKSVAEVSGQLGTVSSTLQKDVDTNVSPSTTRSMPIVAVSREGEGIVGNVTIKLIPGNNNVLINTNPFLRADLQYSMNKAVAVAKQHSQSGFDKDYIFNFQAGQAQLVGGGSAGAAATIGVIAALQDKKLNKNVAITGTINSDGTIGRVGGILEKARAAANAGYNTFLVPEGQAQVTYYERVVEERPSRFGFTIRDTTYRPRTIDLREEGEEWNLTVEEVSNIEQALPHFFN